MTVNQRQILGRSTGTYSHGVSVSAARIIFISGQLPVDQNGKTVGPDMTSQARDVFEKISRLLQEAGASLSNVTKVTAYLTDIGKLAEYARVRGEVFGGEYPASASVEVSALAEPGALLEVEAIAVL